MKKLTVAISAVAASVLMAMSAQAAEIYNKDSNKLDLYGKVNAKHYFSSNDADDGDTTYVRLGFKGETQINDQLTGFGQWEYEFKGNRAESQGSSKDKTRLAFAGLKFGDYGSIDYGRNYGVAYDIGAWTDVLPEFGGDTWTQTDVFMTGRTTGVVSPPPLNVKTAFILSATPYFLIKVFTGDAGKPAHMGVPNIISS